MEALSMLIVPAVVKLVQELNEKDWKSVAKILGAAATGLLGGLVGVFTDPVAGLGFGLSAAGIVTIASYAGPKATK